MATKQTERNGADFEPEVKETAPAKAEPSPVNSPKMVVFRSTDKELFLAKSAGYTDKSHGYAEYHPTEGVQFEEYMKQLDPVEDKVTIDWLRKHPSNGISFREVANIDETELLPPISKLREMTPLELRELCRKRGVEFNEDSGNDKLILDLLAKQ